MPKADFMWLLSEPLKAGEQKLKCICAADRSSFNKHQRTLSVNNEPDRILYHCWHCGEKDAIRKQGLEAPRFKPPEPKPVSKPIGSIYELNEDCYDWLEQERGITKETANKAGLKRGKVRGADAIAFPYYKDNTITGYKLRSIELPKREAFAITGLVDGLFLSNIVDKSHEQLTITEGEFDALALLQVGIKNPVSLPHGAVAENTNPDSVKLNCLAEAADILRPMKRITIATDSDGNGRATYTEIARRVGRYRSYKPVWPDSQGKWDANEVLLEFGPETLNRIITGAEAEAIPGLAKPKKFRADLMRFRNGELMQGASTGYPALDPIFRIAPGIVTTLTGTPGSGKSEIIDQFHVNLAESMGWKTVLWSRETAEFVHVAKLIEKRARKRFHTTMNNCMSDEEIETHLDWVDEHFDFLEHDGGTDNIDSVLERMSGAVLRYGSKLSSVDPFNYIERTGDVRDDIHVSEIFTKVTDWCDNHEAHMFFVAHPTKLVNPLTIPNGNHIAGGAQFWNKTHFGATVHRPNDGFLTEFHVWKAKHAWLGKIGKADLAYDTKTASYFDPDGDGAPIKIRPPSRSDYRYNPDDFDDEGAL